MNQLKAFDWQDGDAVILTIGGRDRRGKYYARKQAAEYFNGEWIDESGAPIIFGERVVVAITPNHKR